MGREINSAAVLVVSWNGKALLEACLECLGNQQDPGCPWSIWVFDNGSKDGTLAWLKQNHPEVQWIKSSVNLGFAEAVNQLIQTANAEVSILLNNDALPQPDWLRCLVETYRNAPQDVAAVGGLALNQDGTRIDFMTGSMAFDGHAFQEGSGSLFPCEEMPATGSELLFANGANMLIQTSAFWEVGGFDKEFFAYFEDVDLGWRLWAQGRRVIFSAEAVVRHINKATSQRLGMFNRGALYERNAYLNAFKNFDATFFKDLMPAIGLTMLHRSQTLLTNRNSGGDILEHFPLDPLSPSANRWQRWRHKLGQEVRQGQWLGAGTLRRFLGFLEQRIPFFCAKVHLNDPWTLTHFQAVQNLFSHLDAYALRRQETQSKRVRSDLEIFSKFPLVVKATYPGDEAFFNSQAFLSLLPTEVPWLKFPAQMRKKEDAK